MIKIKNDEYIDVTIPIKSIFDRLKIETVSDLEEITKHKSNIIAEIIKFLNNSEYGIVFGTILASNLINEKYFEV